MNKLNGLFCGPAQPIRVAQEAPTLRDWFAAQAMTGLLASDRRFRDGFEEAAETAYEMADAMLEWRDMAP